MRKSLNLFLVTLLCSLYMFTMGAAYASDISSVEAYDRSILEENSPNWILQCIHEGKLSYKNVSPFCIDVTITNTVTEAFFLPCTDIMSYTLFFEVISTDGRCINSGQKTGNIGRFCFETWSLGGAYRQTLRLQLVTSIHHQTVTSDWVEVEF